MQTILVTDQEKKWAFAHQHATIVSATEYLSSAKFTNGEMIRVINLCKNYEYQSIGYYVSLLAQARGHKVIPSVLTIQDLKSPSITMLFGESIQEELDKELKNIKSKEFVLSVYFGKNMAQKYAKLCYKLYGLFPIPLFRITFKYKKNGWQVKKCTAISVSDVPPSHIPFLESAVKSYFTKKRFTQFKNKKYKFDLAILVNPEEKTPPSNPEALQKFIDTGDKLGINVELIDKDEYKTLGEYDALFIRETTAVNHHTYRFSRRASSDGLIVLDDPESILKCANKVYLSELLTKHHMPCPPTYVLSKYNWKALLLQIPMPCVLKLPDSAFSKGVVKVNDHAELQATLTTFFKDSDLIIAQAFVPTKFDWRIGILNKEPIFACRYYMADNHWQIYNWEQPQDPEGNFDAVPIDEVPKQIIQLAQKSTRLIGDGLYGVDLKETDKTACIIEINDNPNIDHGVEDQLLGDALYQKIMNYFLTRIHHAHGYT